MTTDSEDKRYRAPALDKGLDIIELLALQPRGMTRAEIVSALGKSHSEIYRMIERLVARNYLSRSIEGDRYALTMKLFHLGALYPPMRRLVGHVQPLMDEFTSQSMQAVHLVVADMGQGLIVARSSSRAAWEFRLRIGALLGLLDTSSGQTLLAFQDEEQAAYMLRAAPETGSDIPPDIAKELAIIRKTGYRLGASRQLVGVTDISVPVQSAYGVTVAVLTCPFLPLVGTAPDEADPMKMEDTLQLLRETAKQASTI
ncbi:IclR family transcriptional regulator [Granulosicoccus antarcticus]|uniref:Pectin degradation repressor protein KdgR n=1 Tax=Granulosicoccus antarcticus IMCC3135 TaxID=1192854 RepID=A0A2Z2NPT8_9GAMM|nr:IclR family transcriptional regulator [Granulosicoccus antarcticus]ASJ73289.1 Pectin degradation repressor protein KdgR [Granulosicoccus antarcticus IMCC3135]